jgi:tetratricopeptide (TPR) repeat protein
MQRAARIGVLAALLAGIAVAASQASRAPAPAPAVHWAKSLPTALAEARAAGKLVLADFYTEECSECQGVFRHTYTNPAVIQELKPLVLARTIWAKAPDLGKKYHVRDRYRTFLLLTPSGQIEGRLVGHAGPETLVQELRRMLRDHAEMAQLEQRAREGTDAEATERLVVVYAARVDFERARTLLEQAEKADPNNEKRHLARAYNAVADHFQEEGQYEPAMELFRKAAEMGKDPYDVVYAYLSLGSCYESQNQGRNATAAYKHALAVPNCPPELKKEVQASLNRLQPDVGGPNW